MLATNSRIRPPQSPKGDFEFLVNHEFTNFSGRLNLLSPFNSIVTPTPNTQFPIPQFPIPQFPIPQFPIPQFPIPQSLNSQLPIPQLPNYPIIKSPNCLPPC